MPISWVVSVVAVVALVEVMAVVDVGAVVEVDWPGILAREPLGF